MHSCPAPVSALVKSTVGGYLLPGTVWCMYNVPLPFSLPLHGYLVNLHGSSSLGRQLTASGTLFVFIDGDLFSRKLPPMELSLCAYASQEMGRGGCDFPSLGNRWVPPGESYGELFNESITRSRNFEL
jgi:hypothetical protein